MNAERIANRLGGTATNNGFICSCPVRSHGRGLGDQHPSLLISDDANGRLRVHCFAGCAKMDVLRALDVPTGTSGPKDSAPPTNTFEYGARLLGEARDPVGTLVEIYLKGRGLKLELPVLCYTRFHPCLKLDGTYYPGMLTIYSDITTGEYCGIERTFLTPEGKKIERRSLGRTRKHAAVKLYVGVPCDQLFVAEGFETAIAAYMLGLRPVWALGSADGIRFFPPIASINKLTILQDNDAAGKRAAEACALRWKRAGKKVFFNTSKVGKDHADIFLKGNPK
jgi:hypothetical protein